MVGPVRAGKRPADLEDDASVEAWLVSDSPAKRELLGATLTGLGRQKSLDYLLQIAQTESKKRIRRINNLVRYVYLPLAAVCVAGQLWRLHDRSSMSGLFILPLLLPSFVLNLGNSKWMQPNALYRAILLRLAQEGDIRALPLMLEFPLFAQRQTPEFGDAIAGLLARIDQANADILTKRHWNMLSLWLLPIHPKATYRELREKLARAMIKAVSNAGKTDLLQRVKTLAATPGKYSEGEQIQQMAQRYVSGLEQAAGEKQTMVVRR